MTAATTLGAPDGSTDADHFDSLNPATGEIIATFPVATAAQVRASVAEARQAAEFWRVLGERGRRTRLRRWRAELVAGIDDLATLMHRENGKPVDEAFLEVALAIAHLDWAAGHAKGVLGRRRVTAGLLAVNHAASVEHLPYGVVGVIGPWNYPVHTPMGSISYALAAGNAVVFKPSEYTPAIASWLVDSFRRAVPEAPVFSLVTGFGPTGAALCASGADKIAFTGSDRTGRQVMASCSQTLTPCVVECGGKDSLIVAADADLSSAAEQALWGAMTNAGQTCAGVERVFVEASVYQEFLSRVTDLGSSLQLPSASSTGDSASVEAGSPYGPITVPGQLGVIAEHIRHALSSGGRALVGGADSVRAPYVAPVILVDVPSDSPAVTDETFGPTMVITPVGDLDEAVRLSNDSRYGLGAAVFSRRHGPRIAEQLDVGMVSINSVLSYAFVPGLPWGGSKSSGFGRIHGREGLREFSRTRAVTKQRFASPMNLSALPPDKATVATLRRLLTTRWGRRSSVDR
jgi:acyl-CoA reductase-like NAD-dependent aldehyde dehydrogenase